MTAWDQKIKARELAEKRRKAPGWLDADQKILEPERAGTNEQPQPVNLMDDAPPVEVDKRENEVDELGDAMDRAFGRSEMG